MRLGLRLLFAFFVVTGLAGAVALLALHSAGAVLCLLALTTGVGALAAASLARSIGQLKGYVAQVAPGAHAPLPRLPGELGELAAAVGEMRDRLEDGARMEHAVRALAHELKAPLAAIHDAAGWLGADLPAGERERLAHQVRLQSQGLLDLGERMGALCRLEGRRAMSSEIDLLALIDEVATAHVPLAIQRGVGLVWESRADIALAGDAESLSLLFANLWTNALDFAPEGTAIAVSLRRVGAQAVFAMRDEGPGVSDFALGQLGQRFFAQPRPRDGLRGSGLGLAIVCQAARLHGGDVAFERAVPGLRVTVRLPA